MHTSKEEKYQIRNNRIILQDPELNLGLDVEFFPKLLPKRPLWGQELDEGCFVAGNVAGTEFFVERLGKPDGQWKLFYPPVSNVLKNKF